MGHRVTSVSNFYTHIVTKLLRECERLRMFNWLLMFTLVNMCLIKIKIIFCFDVT